MVDERGDRRLLGRFAGVSLRIGAVDVGGVVGEGDRLDGEVKSARRSEEEEACCCKRKAEGSRSLLVAVDDVVEGAVVCGLDPARRSDIHRRS